MSMLCTLVVECLGRQIIHDNGGQLPVDEISSLVRFLLPVVGYSKNSGWSNIDGHYSIPTSKMDHAIWSEAKTRICEDERELQRFSFVAIGNIFARAGSSISKDTWRMTVQVYYAWLVGHTQVFGTFLYSLTLPSCFLLCTSSFRL